MKFEPKKTNSITGKSNEVNLKSDFFNIYKNIKTFSAKWESYFQIYDDIFKNYKGKDITFVEVGVSTGGSLEMWKKYFGNNSRIIGVDLNPGAKELEKNGFEIYIGNQSDKNFWRKFYDKVGKIDILLDDGGHKNIQQINTVHHSLLNINDGGLIVVEDTHCSYLKDFKNPSYFSFINYCNKVIELIHRRSDSIKKSKNYYSEKIYSINFYESISVFNIDSRKCIDSSIIMNTEKWNAAIEQRDNEYFDKCKFFIENRLSFLNKIKFFNKIFRKIFYKNDFFTIWEKIKIYLIFREIK